MQQERTRVFPVPGEHVATRSAERMVMIASFHLFSKPNFATGGSCGKKLKEEGQSAHCISMDASFAGNSSGEQTHARLGHEKVGHGSHCTAHSAAPWAQRVAHPFLEENVTPHSPVCCQGYFQGYFFCLMFLFLV